MDRSATVETGVVEFVAGSSIVVEAGPPLIASRMPWAMAATNFTEKSTGLNVAGLNGRIDSGVDTLGLPLAS